MEGLGRARTGLLPLSLTGMFLYKKQVCLLQNITSSWKSVKWNRSDLIFYFPCWMSTCSGMFMQTNLALLLTLWALLLIGEDRVTEQSWNLYIRVAFPDSTCRKIHVHPGIGKTDSGLFQMQSMTSPFSNFIIGSVERYILLLF